MSTRSLRTLIAVVVAVSIAGTSAAILLRPRPGAPPRSEIGRDERVIPKRESAGMIPNQPAASAQPVVTVRHVTLTVAAQSWAPPPIDVEPSLIVALRRVGVEVVPDPARADAIVGVVSRETKGLEFMNGEFGTNFELSFTVRARDRRVLAKFAISGGTPMLAKGSDLRSAGLENLGDGLAMAAAVIAVETGEPAALETVLRGLTGMTSATDALEILEALRFAPSTPRERAYLQVGRGRYAAAAKLGAAAAEPLAAALQARPAWDTDVPDIARALGETGDPSAVTALEQAVASPERGVDGESESIAAEIKALARLDARRTILAITRNCLATDPREPVRLAAQAVLPDLYGKLAVSPGEGGSVELQLRARGWLTTRFDVERAARTQLEVAKVAVAAGSPADAIVDVDYEEYEGGAYSDGRTGTGIRWSVVVVDRVHQRSRAIKGDVSSPMRAREGEDLHAFVVTRLENSAEFRRIGKFVSETLAGEFSGADACGNAP